MTDKKQIRFIRKNGRVIPIRVNKKADDKIKMGAATIATGVAVTVASGFVGGRVARSGLLKSKSILFKAQVSPLIKDPRLKRAVARSQAKQQARVKFIANVFPKIVKNLGIGLGGAVIGEGITKLGEGVTKRDARLGEEIVASASGISVSALAMKAFKRGLRR